MSLSHLEGDGCEFATLQAVNGVPIEMQDAMQCAAPARETRLPLRAGIALEAIDAARVIATRPEFGWIEVGAGLQPGCRLPPIDDLVRLRASYPMALHGAGPLFGRARQFDVALLDGLEALIDRLEPQVISLDPGWAGRGWVGDGARLAEDGVNPPDTRNALRLAAERIDQIQTRLGRKILLENGVLSTACAGSTQADFDERSMLAAIAMQTGCGLMIDVASVLLSMRRIGRDAYGYLDGCAVEHVGAVRLAGHVQDSDDHGRRAAADSHESEVVDEVWDLFAHLVARAGAFPTVVNWGTARPEWSVLLKEARKADALLQTSGRFAESGRRSYAVV